MRLRAGVAAALLALAGCGDEDRTQTDYTASIDKASTSADDTAATVAPAIPLSDTLPRKAPPQDTFALALAPVGSARSRGGGRVAAAGKATSISVALTGAVGGATYEGSVRQGRCGATGAAVASLFPVSADSLGSGQASSDVPVPADSLTEAPHVVVYGRGGRTELCGELRASAPPPPAPRPAPSPPLDTTAADSTRPRGG
ncbi:MAG TPA: hypothetical protein VHG91_20160 [Longimicrobium sp.]|nr:hypothetical protein [Longimicrobium sp.]